jgi:hypothetical protein
MTLRPGFVIVLAALAACSPQDVADKVGRRTAETVVQPVVGNTAATQCIVQNATADEVQLLVRDVGVYAGSSTKALIAGIIARPGTMACFGQSGVAAPVIS